MIMASQTIGVAKTSEAQISTLPSPQEYLRQSSGSSFYLLNRIIQCESGWHANAKNSHSSASGLFQFIKSTWDRYASGSDPFDPYINIDAGIRLYKDHGTVPWNESKPCWGPKNS